MYCRCSQHRTLRSRSQQQDDAELNATHAENQPHLLISATQLTEIVAVGYHLTVSLNGKHWRARTSVVVIVWLPPLPAGCDARQQPRPLEPKQCVSVSMWVCLNGGPKNAEVWSGYFECLNVAIIVYRAASYQCKSIYLYQFAWHTIQKSRVSLPGVPTILPHMYHTSAVLRCVSRTQFPSGAARAHSVFFPLFLHNRSFHRSIWTWTQYAVVLGVSRVMCCFDEQFLFVCIYYQSSVFRMDRRVLDLLSSQRMLSVMSSTVCRDGTKATSIGNIHTECTESTVHDLASFFNSPNDCWKFPSDHPWA